MVLSGYFAHSAARDDRDAHEVAPGGAPIRTPPPFGAASSGPPPAVVSDLLHPQPRGVCDQVARHRPAALGGAFAAPRDMYVEEPAVRGLRELTERPGEVVAQPLGTGRETAGVRLLPSVVPSAVDHAREPAGAVA